MDEPAAVVGLPQPVGRGFLELAQQQADRFGLFVQRLFGAAEADVALREGMPLQMGSVCIDPLFTPGHTDGHLAFLAGERVFTGDALLIDGCGRTDFQNGNAQDLFHSVREKLFTLPDDTLVYPGHDYHERRVSNIAQEKTRNPRLGGDKSLAEFIEIMANLNLAYPKFIDYAVPSNRVCGVCAQEIPEDLQQYCDQMTDSVQG